MEEEYWLVAFAAILSGTITVGGQLFVNLGLSSWEISLGRVLFTCLIILPVVLAKRRYLIKKEMLWFFVVYGLIAALLEINTYGGIVLGVPVAVVAFLMYTQPIWTVVLGKWLLNEQITYRKTVAAGIALTGVALLLKPWGAASIGPAAGIISALLGGMFLSLWVIWGRKSAIEEQHPVTTTSGCAFFSTVWLLLLWPVLDLFIHEQKIIAISADLSAATLLQLMIFALFSGVMPMLLFYKGVQKIPASVAGVILLLEPLSATLLAAILFAQPIGFNILAGGTLILASNYIIHRG